MADGKKRGARGLVLNLAGVLMAFGLLSWTIYRQRVQVARVLQGDLNFGLFGCAIVVYLVATLGTFTRWFMLVRVIEPRFPLRAAYLLGFIGNLFNLVVPGAVGGDVIKGLYLAKMDVRRTQAIASMVIDRILGLLGLFLLAGVAGLFAWPMAGRSVRTLIVLVWCAVGAGMVALGMIFGQSLTRVFPKLLEGESRRAQGLRELKILAETYSQRLGLVGAWLIGASLIHLLNVFAFYLVCLAVFGAKVPSFGQHLVVVPLTLFTTAVPIPFGALGVSESVGYELGKLVHHPGLDVGMMGFRVLMYTTGALSAVIYLANLKQVRALTADA